jgi:hypothetical protein
MADVSELSPAANVALDAWLAMKAERDALTAELASLKTLHEHQALLLNCWAHINPDRIGRTMREARRRQDAK